MIVLLLWRVAVCFVISLLLLLVLLTSTLILLAILLASFILLLIFDLVLGNKSLLSSESLLGYFASICVQLILVFSLSNLPRADSLGDIQLLVDLIIALLSLQRVELLLLLLLETWARLRPFATTIHLWCLLSFRILFLVVLIPQWLLQSTFNRHLLLVVHINIIKHGLLDLCLRSHLTSSTTGRSLVFDLLLLSLTTSIVIIIIIIVSLSIVVMIMLLLRQTLLELHSLLLFQASMLLMNAASLVTTVHRRW